MSRAARAVLTPMGLRLGRRRLPCTMGRAGLTGAKREGDGATPRGLLRIVGTFYRPDRIACPAPWARPLRLRDRWCDAPESPDYNHLVQSPCAARAETLWRGDRLYDLVIVTDWNWPDAQPGAGSAIFLHRWRRPGAPTDGCLAMAPRDLIWLARAAPPGTELLIG